MTIYPTFDYMHNILESNCGSCPTTTNYTTVTCTDVPTNGSTCTLAVQTVVCTEDTDCTTGISSDLISMKVLNTRSSHNTMEHSSTNTMLIASIIFLVVSTVTCIAVSVMVTTIALMRNRARIKSILDDFWQINRTLSTATHLEGTYDDVIDASPSVRLNVISTRHNVAYAQKQM